MPSKAGGLTSSRSNNQKRKEAQNAANRSLSRAIKKSNLQHNKHQRGQTDNSCMGVLALLAFTICIISAEPILRRLTIAPGENDDQGQNAASQSGTYAVISAFFGVVGSALWCVKARRDGQAKRARKRSNKRDPKSAPQSSALVLAARKVLAARRQTMPMEKTSNCGPTQ